MSVSKVAFAVLAVSAAAQAAVPTTRNPMLSPFAIRPDGSYITTPSNQNVNTPPAAATGISTGFESPFVPGTIAGQQGWNVSTISSVAINNQVISTTTPITAAQSLKITKATAAAAGASVGSFSPVSVQPAPDASVSSFSLRIDGVTPGAATGGADYNISGQSPAQAFITFRVNFSYLGTINVLDYPGVGQTGTLGFQATTATWTPGTNYNVSVSFVPLPTATPGATNALGSIVYRVNGVPVYTADSLIAATKSDQFVVTSDSFQVAGESATFDNLSITAVPEPTTLAALAGAGLIGLRRRRA